MEGKGREERGEEEREGEGRRGERPGGGISQLVDCLLKIQKTWMKIWYGGIGRWRQQN